MRMRAILATIRHPANLFAELEQWPGRGKQRSPLRSCRVLAETRQGLRFSFRQLDSVARRARRESRRLAGAAGLLGSAPASAERVPADPFGFQIKRLVVGGWSHPWTMSVQVASVVPRERLALRYRIACLPGVTPMRVTLHSRRIAFLPPAGGKAYSVRSAVPKRDKLTWPLDAGGKPRFFLQGKRGTRVVVAFPPKGDIAEIRTTRSRTAHSCKNGPPE
jgi:hypothetical protein